MAVLADEDARKERLVEKPSLERRAGHVGRVRCLGLIECVLEGSVDVLCLQLGFAEQALGLLLLGFEATLLAGQYLVGDEPLIRELDEVELVVLKSAERAVVAVDLVMDDSGALLGIASYIGPYSVADFLGQSYGSVVLLKFALDEMRGIVAGTAAAAGVPRGAVDAREVLVEPAFTAVLGVEQPTTAFSAVEAPPQIVLVF